jgi:phenylpyruvate tautomerase PptA (4-oxalocrotonate tautomerase family)
MVYNVYEYERKVMPTIQVKSTVVLNQAVKDAVKSEFGQAIALIPGKSEQWLMVLFEKVDALYFQSVENANAALVEVGIKGHASRDDFGKLGAEITAILVKHTDLQADSIYIAFTEYDNYAYNGGLL